MTDDDQPTTKQIHQQVSKPDQTYVIWILENWTLHYTAYIAYILNLWLCFVFGPYPSGQMKLLRLPAHLVTPQMVVAGIKGSLQKRQKTI